MTGKRIVLIGIVALMVAVLLPKSLRSMAKLELGVLPEMEQAQRTGKPVEVVGQRTATETTWANPGGDFRREISAVPVRARVGDKWLPIDLKLERKADGTVGPKAPPDPVSLSGGGEGSLLATTIGGVQIVAGWSGGLPKPTLKGPSATYAEVWPGVDLKMTATPSGVSQVLVVKNRKAAENPVLRRITLPTVVKGGLIRGANGGFAVVDGNGREVGVAPRPTMWDSSSSASRQKSANASGTDVDIPGPSAGDKVTNVPLTVGKAAVVLRPDTEALTGPDVAYPVMIDPQVSPATQAWTGIRQQNPTASYYKWTYDSLHAGFQGTQLQRLFWKFTTTSLAGADISSVTFVGNLVGTYSCDARGMQLWRTSVIDSSTTWNNQPTWMTNMATFTDQAASGCGVYGKRVEVPVSSTIAPVVKAGTSSVTLGLRATTESSDLSAKWFAKEAALNFIYKFPTDLPSNLSLADPTLPCSPNPVIGGVAPRVSATITDPDEANLRLEFEAYSGTSASGTAFWSEKQAIGRSSERLAAEPTAGSRHTSTTRVQYPNGSLPNGTYTWRVRAADPDAGFVNVETPWVSCTFTVDNTVVAKPGVIIPAGTTWTLGEDPVSVTLDPTETVTDPTPENFAYYRWSMNSQTPTSENVIPVGADRRSTILVAPTKGGPNMLRIWAYNTAGSVSDSKDYQFGTDGVSGDYAAQYLFDEEAGDSSADETAAHRDLSGVTGLWTQRGTYQPDGETDEGDYLLRFTGTETTTPPHTAGSAIATNQSFTVSAWLRPDEVGDRVAVSQGTATQSNFTLGTSTSCLSPVAGCYRFGVRNAAGTMIYVESTRTVSQDLVTAPTKPRMIHLVGDISKAGSLRLRIIVDGIVVENRATTGTPAQVSTGPLLIGAARAASAYTARWKGDIDNVMVKQGLLDDVALVQLDAADSGRCYTSDRLDRGATPCAS